MKPPAEVSAEIAVATARCPAGRIADMKPRSERMSFASLIGSPVTKLERAMEPVSSARAPGRASRVM